MVPMRASSDKVIDDLSDSSDYDDESPNVTDSESATSHHGGKDVTNDKKAEDKANMIAQLESLAVVRIRFIVVFVLILSTVTVSLVVYFFTSKAETQESEHQFRDSSAKVVEALGSALDRTRGAADAFSVILMSYTKITNSTWPYVTLPDFPVHAAKARGMSKAAMLAVYPYVEDSQRAEWEAYSTQNSAWVNKSIDLQKDDPNFHGSIIETWSGFGSIHNNSGPVTTPGPYLPTWQVYPVVPVYSPFNWDLHADPTLVESVDKVLHSKEVVIGKTINLARRHESLKM
jgi:hypothetical protein